MLMQNLPPEERKGEDRYKRGSFIRYDDRPDQEEVKRKLLENPNKYIALTCVWCGRTFLKPYYSLTTKKYCSQRCVNDSYMARRRKRHELNCRRICVVCGQEFQGKKQDALYCSGKCKQKAYRERKRYE